MASLGEGILFLVFLVTSLIAGTYWWLWVLGRRERLPSWGIRLYITCGLIGSAAGVAFAILSAQP